MGLANPNSNPNPNPNPNPLTLTRWDERSFTGGETTIMQPHVLDYWRAC